MASRGVMLVIMAEEREEEKEGGRDGGRRRVREKEVDVSDTAWEDFYRHICSWRLRGTSGTKAEVIQVLVRVCVCVCPKPKS
jgi:hypothetical protein